MSNQETSEALAKALRSPDCHYCGSVMKITPCGSGHTSSFCMECENCGARSPKRKTGLEAIEAWNTRALPQTPSEPTGAIKKALEDAKELFRQIEHGETDDVITAETIARQARYEIDEALSVFEICPFCVGKQGPGHAFCDSCGGTGTQKITDALRAIQSQVPVETREEKP